MNHHLNASLKDSSFTYSHCLFYSETRKMFFCFDALRPSQQFFSHIRMFSLVSDFVFIVPPTAKVILETGPWLRVSSDRLEEPGIKLGTPGTLRVVYPLHQGSSHNFLSSLVES